MQKLRAITDQLNTDFAGLQKDAPLMIWFQDDPNTGTRYDQIMFFASGDFQSTRVYKGANASGPAGYGTRVPDQVGTPIAGNVARIYYGQAQSRDPRDNNIKYPYNLLDVDRLLARRRHILTADPYLYSWFTTDFSGFAGVEFMFSRYTNNDFYEHDSLSLSAWKNVDAGFYKNVILGTCFGWPPVVDLRDAQNTIHNLIDEGIGSFAIQWAYWDTGLDPVAPNDDRWRWFPSNDPYGDNSGTDSHFGLIAQQFGVYFNVPGQTTITNWIPMASGSIQYKSVPAVEIFKADFYPKALKFTFTIYDSKGIIEKGKTFTHIVYLD